MFTDGLISYMIAISPVNKDWWTALKDWALNLQFPDLSAFSELPLVQSILVVLFGIIGLALAIGLAIYLARFFKVLVETIVAIVLFLLICYMGLLLGSKLFGFDFDVSQVISSFN